MLKIAHIVNPFESPKGSLSRRAQEISLACMTRARSASLCSVNVDQFVTSFPDEDVPRSNGFSEAEPLDRSAQSLPGVAGVPRLPFLQDIIDRLYNASDAEYFIYTNMDISIQPYFYDFVARQVAAGVDACVINHRTIPDPGEDYDILDLYAAVGVPHGGFDCFVFRRSAYEEFVLGDVCLGVSMVGMVLLWNLCVSAQRFVEFGDSHLTFHLGDDMSWASPKYEVLHAHNWQHAMQALSEIERKWGPFDKDHPLVPYLLRVVDRWRRRQARGVSITGRPVRRRSTLP